MNFPPHNTLIPTEFDLKERVAANCKEPILLKSVDGTDLWYQQDAKFDKPKEIVTMYLYTNDCLESNSPKGDVFVALWKNVMHNY
jgi:secreted Zn-dependent insulinase-like peptidase